MKLCLGTVQLGQEYGIRGNKRLSFDECISLLEKAVFNYGVDIFDTAAAYGDAEAILGRFFTLHPECRQTVAVVTKLPFFSDAFGFDAAHAQLKQSLSRLCLERADGLLLHDERDAADARALEVLARLKESGLVRHIGVSVYEPDIALAAAANDIFDYIQIPYNALDRRLEKNGFFTLAKRHDKIIFARSAFLQGLLVMDDIPVAGAESYVRAFQRLCAARGFSPAQGCVNYINANKSADYLVMGIDRPEELAENMRFIAQEPDMAFVQDVRAAIQCDDRHVLMPGLWKRR